MTFLPPASAEQTAACPPPPGRPQPTASLPIRHLRDGGVLSTGTATTFRDVALDRVGWCAGFEI